MRTLTLLLTTAAMACAQLIVDDFNTGKYTVTVKAGEQNANVQSGTMAGGFRLSNLVVGALPYGAVLNRSCTLTLGKSPALVECGAKATQRIELHYGVDQHGASAPLNLNLTGFDRFRVVFDTIDTGLNINLEVFTGSNYALLRYNVPPTNGS